MSKIICKNLMCCHNSNSYDFNNKKDGICELDIITISEGSDNQYKNDSVCESSFVDE